ncbi:hypothetical protein VTL71DRAFT_8006 [Oculimacula yallundae]|uniref:Uncharacterized protein n=1 Tax=Oculimacula yallundae TaxID=86028 RepID=A0ABR4CXX2_9HELO
MKRCAVPYGRSTAKCFATTTRSHYTRLSSFPGIRTRWELSRACQRKGISSTSQHIDEPIILGTEEELCVDSTTGTTNLGGITAGKGTIAEETDTTCKSQPSEDANTESKSAYNVLATGPRSDDPSNDHGLPFKRRPLPLSPLMDPAFLESKRKHRAPKLPPTKTPTPFQQQLAKNPFARALATPVRRCAVSGTKLPSYFLQGFRVMSQPETGEPWYVPTKLANKHLPAKSREILDQAEELEEAEEMVETDEAKEETALEPKPTPSTIGYQAYTLNRKVLLQSMLKIGNRNGGKNTEMIHRTLIPVGWRSVKSAQKFYQGSGWREDMEDFVPMLMGRRISEALSHLWSLKRGYLVGCADWEDALKKKQVAAFLWTGGKGDGEAEVEGLPEFATLDVGSEGFDTAGPVQGRRKRKVPVYNLQKLLGKEKMDELRQQVPNSVFEANILVLRHKRVTVELQSQLWKIEGYLAEHRNAQVAHSESYEDAHGEEPREYSEASGYPQ